MSRKIHWKPEDGRVGTVDTADTVDFQNLESPQRRTLQSPETPLRGKAAPLLKAVADALIQIVDTDGDGALDLGEVVQTLTKNRKILRIFGLPDDASEDEVYEVFVKIDRDQNNRISSEELQEFALDSLERIHRKQQHKASYTNLGTSFRRSSRRGSLLQLRSISEKSKKYNEAKEVPKKLRDTIKLDDERRELLATSRLSSPIDQIFFKLSNTVVPRVFTHKMFWLILFVFVVASLNTHFDTVWVLVKSRDRYCELNSKDKCYLSREYQDDAFTGVADFVPFVIVFYVGYCYQRFKDQYSAAMDAQKYILDACTIARGCLKNEKQLHTLWRYLNIIHVAGFVGLSRVYDQENLFDPFCETYKLLPIDEERACIESLGIGRGESVYCEVVVWASELVGVDIQDENPDRLFIHLGNTVLSLRNSIKTLFEYQFQVMPFVYTHLVSMGTWVYLLLEAGKKGALWIPDREADDGTLMPGNDLYFGLVFPALSLIFTEIFVIGLLVIGDALTNPFGMDKEDLAVFHFCNSTASQSRRIIETKGMNDTSKERRLLPDGQMPYIPNLEEFLQELNTQDHEHPPNWADLVYIAKVKKKLLSLATVHPDA